MVRHFALGLALAGMAACSFPEEPLPPGDARIVVHAVLDPSRTTQLVELAPTDGSPLKSEDLDSAIVVLTLPDGRELTAKQDSEPTTPYDDYFFDPITATYRFDLQGAAAQLIPGATYRLRITVRNGDVITGSTTIPAATPAPVPGLGAFNRSRDTLRLSWDAVSGARGYELLVWRSFAQYTNSWDLTYTAFVSDSVRLAGTARYEDDDIFMPTSRATVYLMAVDENYYEYYRMVGDPYVGASPGRLQGALGVFGSVVPIARRELAVQ